MKKINSEFVFSTEFINHKEKNQKAEVLLQIDYQRKTFNISPNYIDFDTKNHFSFIGGNTDKVNLWMAVNKSIKKAILFANEELSIK